MNIKKQLIYKKQRNKKKQLRYIEEMLEMLEIEIGIEEIIEWKIEIIEILSHKK